MSIADGKIQNFALMNKIADLTGKPEYKELDFKHGRARSLSPTVR